MCIAFQDFYFLPSYIPTNLFFNFTKIMIINLLTKLNHSNISIYYSNI
uniref:Uncharacterized protein n=1 Tax=Siphoviridae sp. ctSqC25 TaxID=2823582 RepID=A0A8S5L655_9CAUD|nr:MAG TPA: hypothetical protein [Siphoviridae sp. ctSqC25]